MQPLKKALDAYLNRFDPDGRHYLFIKLCRHWPEVVGSELAALAAPLGRRQNTLILGARDSIVIQELTLQQWEILDKIHSFCDCVLFDKLRVELLKGRASLHGEQVSVQGSGYTPSDPGSLGDLKDYLPPDSPVTRCYIKHVEFFKKHNKS